MDFEAWFRELIARIQNRALDNYAEALAPLARALQAFIDQLEADGFPADWRERYAAFIAEQEISYELDPASIRDVETAIKRWVEVAGPKGGEMPKSNQELSRVNYAPCGLENRNVGMERKHAPNPDVADTSPSDSALPPSEGISNERPPSTMAGDSQCDVKSKEVTPGANSHNPAGDAIENSSSISANSQVGVGNSVSTGSVTSSHPSEQPNRGPAARGDTLSSGPQNDRVPGGQLSESPRVASIGAEPTGQIDTTPERALTRPIGELRAMGLKDAHHVIQDAAMRNVPGYQSTSAPGVQLAGPPTKPGSPHYLATQVQRESGGGTYAAERRIGYKALRAAGFSESDARQAINESDAYFFRIGVTLHTRTRVPGTR